MVFKPNYNMQRAERNRAKQAKKEEKLREREEAVARRKAGLDADDATGATGAAEAAPSDVEAPKEGTDGT